MRVARMAVPGRSTRVYNWGFGVAQIQDPEAGFLGPGGLVSACARVAVSGCFSRLFLTIRVLGVAQIQDPKAGFLGPGALVSACVRVAVSGYFFRAKFLVIRVLGVAQIQDPKAGFLGPGGLVSVCATVLVLDEQVQLQRDAEPATGSAAASENLRCARAGGLL